MSPSLFIPHLHANLHVSSSSGVWLLLGGPVLGRRHLTAMSACTDYWNISIKVVTLGRCCVNRLWSPLLASLSGPHAAPAWPLFVPRAWLWLGRYRGLLSQAGEDEAESDETSHQYRSRITAAHNRQRQVACAADKRRSEPNEGGQEVDQSHRRRTAWL